MAQLVPSILETSQDKFLDTYAREIKLPGVQRIQVDFGDGIFVPNKMLSISEIDMLTPAIKWEAHLMIQNPTDFLDYQICGFKTIVVHYEAYNNPDELRQALATIKSMNMEPVVCIKNQTPVSVLRDFASEVSHFQLMSVNPGFQGSAFLENTYDRILELKKLIPGAIIEVDGGVNLENIKKLSQSGADLLILGAAITKAPNMLEAYEKMQNEMN